MKQVIRMLDSNLDDVVARRIAIEIRVEEEQKQFISCAKRLLLSIDNYHPQIAEVLREYEKLSCNGNY